MSHGENLRTHTNFIYDRYGLQPTSSNFDVAEGLNFDVAGGLESMSYREGLLMFLEFPPDAE
jgi:hypothetical protein